jgi:hypothetical protein
VAADGDSRGSKTTRRGFLAAAGCGVVAFMLGERLAVRRGSPAPIGAARPRRADNVAQQATAAGIQLRPTPADPNGPVFRLNRSAALIWRNVDGRRTVTQLAGLLGTAYGLSAAQASSDTIACLETLAGQGLVYGMPGRGEAHPT